MAKSADNLNAVFQDTADAIRAKGVSGKMTPRDFADKIASIPTGITPTGTKDITANGNNIDVTEYAAVNVNVPNPSSGTLQITENGEGINVTNYAYVDVNVSGAGAAIIPVSKSILRATSNTSTERVIKYTDDTETASELNPIGAYSYDLNEDGKVTIHSDGSWGGPESGYVILASGCDYDGDTAICNDINYNGCADGRIITLAGIKANENVQYDTSVVLSIGLLGSPALSDESAGREWLESYYNLSYGDPLFTVKDAEGNTLFTLTLDDVHVDVSGAS